MDSGFYTVSDKAAGSLVKVIGHRLPKFGYHKFVMLETEHGHKLNAWLQRTDIRSQGLRRGWKWALASLRFDGERSMVTLGRSFQFVAIKSTV